MEVDGEAEKELDEYEYEFEVEVDCVYPGGDLYFAPADYDVVLKHNNKWVYAVSLESIEVVDGVDVGMCLSIYIYTWFESIYIYLTTK